MNSGIAGVEVTSMTKAIDDLTDKTQKITEELKKLEDLVSDTNSYIKSDIGISLRRKFQTLSSSFPTIIDNLNTTILELNTCKNNYIKQDENAAILFKDYVD